MDANDGHVDADIPAELPVDGPVDGPTAEGGNQVESDSIRSLARLAVGLGLMGTEQLLSGLRRWEGQVTDGMAEEGTSPSPPPDLGSAVVGSAFDLGRRIKEGLPRAADAGARGARATWLMVNLVGLSGVVRFAGRHLEPARQAVVDEFERLAALGREEEARSRRLVQTAFREGVADATAEVGGRAIEAITQSPKVRQMIRVESTGVAEQALDGMRRRTANVDDILDRRTRSMFRRSHVRPSEPAAGPAATAVESAPAASVEPPPGPARDPSPSPSPSSAPDPDGAAV